MEVNLQTRNLVMVGLSVLSDAPSNPYQPPLRDGIHLRWAFKPELGFPWYGFSLFRRRHLPDADTPVCVSQSMGSLSRGPQADKNLNIPSIGQFSSDTNLFLTDDFPPSSALEFDLDGRSYLHFTPVETVHRVEVRLGFHAPTRVAVVALSGDTPVVQTSVEGAPGQMVTATLEFDAITAVELSAGPAALVDLCFVPVSQNARLGWQPVDNFPYPLCLPLTHPDYPCTQGINEDLSRARAVAKQRIWYGDPAQFISIPGPILTTGTISVVNGSPLVKGTDTQWRGDLVGAVLQVSGDSTAYTIMAVVTPNKLVLSRDYAGTSRNGTTYAAYQDGFGQFHDQLAQLVTGGSAADPMMNGFMPVPISSGTASFIRDHTEVWSDGTSWTDDVVDLTLEVVDVEVNLGTVSVFSGSPEVYGFGTTWGSDLIGLTFQIAGERARYTVKYVDSPIRLQLNRGYTGATGDGKAYTIVEKTPYTIKDVTNISPTRQQLKLDRGYAGDTVDTGTNKSYAIVGRMQPEEAGEVTPVMSRQYPLDLVLLATLHPAVAQMIGLYWIDRPPDPTLAYDYLIVADYEGQASKFPNRVLNWIAHNGFDHLWAYIVFNKKMAPSPALSAPDDVRVYALPGGTIRPCEDVTNNAGLRWNRGVTGLGILLPGQPIMNHLWRADLGNGETPTAPGAYTLLTQDRPALPAETQLDPAETIQYPPIWPPFSLHAIDGGLRDGWYSYQVSGIDIFGRHSANSAAGPWYQWTPAPVPPPWYYQDPAPPNGIVHPFAVRLLDKDPPPSPTGIEAYALDRLDPTLLKDAAYTAWWNSLTTSSWYQAFPEAEKQNLIGLRVRWLWTAAHMQQAPDTREFRIYYHPGQMNALLGSTRSVTAVSGTVSAVETDIDNTRPVNAYIGAWLQIGPDSFEIVASEASSPLRVQVKSGPVISSEAISAGNGSPTVTGDQTNWDKTITGFTLKIAGEPTEYTILKVEDPPAQQLTLDRGYVGSTGGGKAYTITGKLPRANAPCTLVIPPVYTAGTISAVNRSPTVTGVGTNWHAEFAGAEFQVAGDAAVYIIVRVDSPTQLTLDRDYEGINNPDKRYLIRHPHPLFDDYTVPTPWEERYYVVGYDEHVAETLPPLLDSNRRELSGAAATVAGAVVSLDGSPDLSGIRLAGEHLFLANDSNRPDKRYCITAIDNVAKTVTVDGMPNIGGASSGWVIGFPLRTYEVFLPDPGGTFRRGLPLTPALAGPIVYAYIGVSAADDKRHTLDNPRWSEQSRGGWGGSERFGNEGHVGQPAKIFRVLREPPLAPVPPPPDSDRVYASPPDYHSRSYYTYRWRPPVDPAHPERLLPLRCHIFRALDDSLFKTDWEQRSRSPITLSADPSDEKYFPVEWQGPEPSKIAKRQQIADHLNRLNSFAHDASGTEQAMAYYRQLLNDDLRVLAGLPGNKGAFTQLTIRPLDPDDPTNADIKGPDSPDDYILNPNLRAYVDTLDGRAPGNCYFYRAAYVDSAHNRSELSSSTVPVCLPNVVPPRAPVITKVLGGDRQIILKWASNREPDVREYRVYRIDSEEAARDLRLMTLVHTEPVASGDPAVRPAEVEFVDTTVIPYQDNFYRLVALDGASNASVPSLVVTGWAYDYGPPAEPIWERSEWVKLDSEGNEHPWTDNTPALILAVALAFTIPQGYVSALVQRQDGGWRSITSWTRKPLSDSTSIPWHFAAYDTTARPTQENRYRAKLMSLAGVILESSTVRMVLAP